MFWPVLATVVSLLVLSAIALGTYAVVRSVSNSTSTRAEPSPVASAAPANGKESQANETTTDPKEISGIEVDPQLVAKPSGKVKDLIEQGNASYARKDYKKALATYSEAIQQDPRSALAYAHRAHAHQALGNNDNAITDANTALKLDANSFMGYYSRGLALLHEKRWDGAVSDLTKAIELNPKSSRSFYSRGNAYAGRSDNNLAIKDYTQAIQLDPDFAEAYRKRAAVYTKLNDRTRANADLQKARRIEQARQERQIEQARQERQIEQARRDNTQAEPKTGNNVPEVPKATSITSVSSKAKTAADAFPKNYQAPLSSHVDVLEMGISPKQLPNAFEKVVAPASLGMRPWEKEVSIYYCSSAKKSKDFPDYIDGVLACFVADRLYKVVYKIKLVQSDLSPSMLTRLGVTENVPKAEADKIEARVKRDLLAKYKADATIFEDPLDFQFISFPNLTDAKFQTFQLMLVAKGAVRTSLNVAKVPGGMKAPTAYTELKDNQDCYWTNFRSERGDLFVALEGQNWDTVGNRNDPSGPISYRSLNVYHIWTPLVETYGDAYAILKRAEMTIETLRPTNGSEFLERANAYMTTEAYDKAISDFTSAVQLLQSPFSAYLGRGYAYLAKNDLDRAIADFTDAIRFNPADARAHYGRSNAYRLKGNEALAEADRKEAVRLDAAVKSPNEP